MPKSHVVSELQNSNTSELQVPITPVHQETSQHLNPAEAQSMMTPFLWVTLDPKEIVGNVAKTKEQAGQGLSPIPMHSEPGSA